MPWPSAIPARWCTTRSRRSRTTWGLAGLATTSPATSASRSRSPMTPPCRPWAATGSGKASPDRFCRLRLASDFLGNDFPPGVNLQCDRAHTPEVGHEDTNLVDVAGSVLVRDRGKAAAQAIKSIKGED